MSHHGGFAPIPHALHAHRFWPKSVVINQKMCTLIVRPRFVVTNESHDMQPAKIAIIFSTIFCSVGVYAQYSWSNPWGPQVLELPPPGANLQAWQIQQIDSKTNRFGIAMGALNARTKEALDSQAIGLAGASAMAGLDAPFLAPGETWAGASAGAFNGRGAVAVGISHSFQAGSNIKFSASTAKTFTIGFGKKW